MIRNESDVIAEFLATTVRWFDRILVLDGTDDPDERAATDALLAAHPEVVHVARDDEFAARGPITDGARQFLLDEVRHRYGVDNWIGILHADEFIDQDPRPMLTARHPVTNPSIRVRLAHTFLHHDDESSWPALEALPLRDRVRHLMWPGVPESRFFFDAGDRDYDRDLHSKVVPRSLRPGPLVDGFVVTQYNERRPAQVLERARQRSESGWQTGHYHRFLGPRPRVFTDSLDHPDAPFAPEFSGDPEGPFAVRRVGEVPAGPIPPGAGVTSEELQSLVDRWRPAAVIRWSRRMRHSGPAGAGRFTTNSPGDVPGYLALLRHTEAVLRSPRCSSAQRDAVAREFSVLIERCTPGSGAAGE